MRVAILVILLNREVIFTNRAMKFYNWIAFYKTGNDYLQIKLQYSNHLWFQLFCGFSLPLSYLLNEQVQFLLGSP